MIGAFPLLILSLTSCGNSEGVTRAFGLTRDAPDEFEVTTRAPLSMPPDFTLRPPQPGAARPQEQSQRRQAEATLAPQVELSPDTATGPAGAGPSSGAASGGLTSGQKALVDAAGPSAPADIRRTLTNESVREDRGSSFTDKLLFWRAPTPPGVVVDPQKEAQRLRANAALGRSVEAGDTPIIQRKKDTLFDSLF